MCMNSAPYDGQQKGLPLNLPCIILSLLNSPVTGLFSFRPKKILYAKLYDIWMSTKRSYRDLFTSWSQRIFVFERLYSHKLNKYKVASTYLSHNLWKRTTGISMHPYQSTWYSFELKSHKVFTVAPHEILEWPIIRGLALNGWDEVQHKSNNKKILEKAIRFDSGNVESSERPSTSRKMKFLDAVNHFPLAEVAPLVSW